MIVPLLFRSAEPVMFNAVIGPILCHTYRRAPAHTDYSS
jgi:hypothetical protein